MKAALRPLLLLLGELDNLFGFKQGIIPMLLNYTARVIVVIRFETVGLTALTSFDATDDGAVRVNGLAVALKANHEV